jgi:hypothetical protein
MTTSMNTTLTAVPVPPESAITGLYARVDFSDAYAVQLPPTASTDPDVLARFIFLSQAGWANGLMVVRDAVVARFGLKTSAELTVATPGETVRRVGIFRVYSTTTDEIVLGEDDRHLDFRLSLRLGSVDAATRTRVLTLSTVVHCHNALGRTYIGVIAPFHRLIVKSCLRRAARSGWPSDPPRNP